MYKRYFKIIIKALILAILMSFERVIALPILSLLLALFWANNFSYAEKMFFAFILSIILATIYQISFSLSIILLGLLYLLFVVMQIKIKNYSWSLLLSSWGVCVILLINGLSSWWGLIFQSFISLIMAIFLKRYPVWRRIKGFRSSELEF